MTVPLTPAGPAADPTQLSLRTELFIGGAWSAASDGARLLVHDPATGQLIVDVASATVADGIAAVEAAATAAPAWERTPPRERGEVLRRAFELLTARREAFATLIVRENGKSLADARAEVAYAAEFFRWFAEEAVRNVGSISTAPSGSNRIVVIHQPVGVSILVTPWNFPAAMATRKIAPALAAGCAVVLKPASETPLTALAIADLLAESGVPNGVVNVVPSQRSGEVVGAMLRHRAVRQLSFTGSTETGRWLLAQAAANVIRCSMELGGNAPFIVFADADIDAAVEGAMVAKMRNGGEACTAANRIYVETSVVRPFTERLGQAMAALRLGPGLDPASQVGPLISEVARAKVSRLVNDAVAAGSTIITGAAAPERPGYFYLPTVLADVASDAPILTEEIFGPVAPVVAFRDAGEAVELANSTPHGLVSYVYTGNLAKGLAVSEAIESGMVGINRGLVSDPAAPFGGMKQSGLGREGAHDGLLEFLETKYIAVAW